MVETMNALALLQQKLQEALTGLAPEPVVYAAMLKPAQDARFGDYQANCAMSLAKPLGKPPREVAGAIVERLQLGEVLETPSIAGPGFINLTLRRDWLARQIQQMAGDRLGVAPVATPRTFVIDYSSPNVAKPMHVGHLRSTIIGDALARLLRFLGHKVITDNHLGDWGTQFGILLYGYKHYLDAAAFKANPVAELARLYVYMRKLFRQSEDDDADNLSDPIQEACRQETAKLHAGDPENLRLWREFMPHCYAEIECIYQRLDVHFDHTHGESFYQPMLADVVRDLRERGIAQESNGAVVVFFDEKESPALIQKRDGAFTYTTTDLATIRYRIEQWHPDAILYFVDFRQGLHFKNLFEIARRWGYDKVQLEHVSFGSVLEPDGRPLAARRGTSVYLESLLDDAIAAAATVYEENRQKLIEQGKEVIELSEEERCQLHEVVGLGAVKYSDLSQNRTSDYKFILSKMVAMDGNTATYMQYAYARNRAILRKAKVDEESLRKNPPSVSLVRPEERNLAVQLLRFEEALAVAATEYKPSAITSYLWDLAKTFSTFYDRCKVLEAETPELRQSRLLLCDLTARVIQRGLDLLGIRTVERM
jgi:arginyl-tRNA synthetase